MTVRSRPMVCLFFVRRHEVLRIEICADERTSVFTLLVKESDGRERREHFVDAGQLQDGLTRMEVRLREESWLRAGAPIVIPDR